MTKLIVRWVINAIALWVAITFVSGIHAQPSWAGIFALALIFGLVNALLRPLLHLLTCPLIVLTLGLGTLIINTLLFWLSGVIGNQFGVGFTVDGFWPAFFGSLIVTLVSIALALLMKDELKGKRKREQKKAQS
ncbi:MAG: phage holin family protein [Chloroflexi bacterium]|nr:phage holin family protein [Chloroflexota bacterium]